MQGIVFTYRKKNRRDKPAAPKKGRIKAILARWWSVAAFAVVLVAGLSVGCFTVGGLSSDTLKNLDFLFTTNLPQRLSGGAVAAFCAGFASNFLFLLAAFLMGLSLWGVVSLPFIAFLKGFGIGVSAGYLVTTYGFKGILFYLAVLLPGLGLFSTVLVYELSSALNMFRRLCATLFGRTARSFREPFLLYLRTGLKYLAACFLASVLDAVLWMGLAGLFFG